MHYEETHFDLYAKYSVEGSCQIKCGPVSNRYLVVARYFTGQENILGLCNNK